MCKKILLDIEHLKYASKMLKLYEVTTCVYISFPMIGLDLKNKNKNKNWKNKISRGKSTVLYARP